MFKNIRINKVSVWLSVILPLFSLLFMATIFGNGQIENVPVGFVDHNNSVESRKIINMLAASPSLDIRNHSYANETQAREAMQKMDIYGYVVIPDKFESDLFKGNEPTISYYYHYAALAVGGEVNRAFTTVLSNYKAQLLQEQALKGGLNNVQTKAVVLPVSPQTTAIGNAILNYTTYISYPFFFVFLQIIILTIIVYTVGKEIQMGQESSIINILVSIVPLIIIYICETLFANFVFFGLLNVPSVTPPTLITISSLLFVLATVSFALIIIIAVPRMSIAMSLASLIGALGATLCGVTFPLDQMSPIFQHFSYLFPIRYFTEIQHNLMYNYIGLEHTWIYFCVLLSFVLAALLLMPRLSKILKKSSTEEKKSNFTHAVPVIYTIALLMIGGTYGYGLIYNLMYDPNIVTKIPMVVVDKSNTDVSRKYTSYINATQGIDVKYSALDFHQAKELMKTQKAKGIIYIPADFDKDLFNGKGGDILIYQTTTAFLYYLTMQASSVAAIQQLNNDYRESVLASAPVTALLSVVRTPQVNLNGRALYNQNNGYGSFLLPIVMCLIIFQIMLLSMGSFLGSRTEALFTKHSHGNRKKVSPFFALGKEVLLFAVGFWAISFALLGLFPRMFGLPVLGNQFLIFTASLMFVLATGSMAAACSFFFRDRERVMLYVSFFSVGLVFLSGLSFPYHQMPWFWSKMFNYIFPSTPFVRLFVKTNTLGASYNMVCNEMLVLIAQFTVYFCIAMFVYKKRKLTLLSDLAE